MHLIYGILEKPVHSLQAINASALHGGLQRVQLLKPNISIPELPSDMKSMEITAPDVVIPSQETTYWCYMAELPEGFPKHHIVMVRGRRRGLLFFPPGWIGNGTENPEFSHPEHSMSQRGFQTLTSLQFWSQNLFQVHTTSQNHPHVS